MNGIQALTTPMRPGSVGNTPKGAGPAVVPEPLKNLMGLVDFLTTSAPTPQGQAAPPVAAQVAQAAAQKMGVGAPAVSDVAETAVPAMAQKQMQDQAAMQRMAQQMAARSRPPAGITSLDPDIVPLKEGGIIGYAGPEGSFVDRLPKDSVLRMLRDWIEEGRPSAKRPLIDAAMAQMSGDARTPEEAAMFAAVQQPPQVNVPIPDIAGAATPAPAAPATRLRPQGRPAAPAAAPAAPAAPADENPFMQMIADQLKAGLGAKAPTFDETQAVRAQARKAAGVPEGPAGQATEQGITALRGALQKVLSAGQMTPQEQAWEKFHRFAAGAQGAGTAGGALSGGTRGVMSLEAAQRKGERDKAMLEYNLEKIVIDMQADIEKARRAEADRDYEAYKDAMNAYSTKQNQLNNLLGTAASAKESSLTRREATEARKEMARQAARLSPEAQAFEELRRQGMSASDALARIQGIMRPGKQEDVMGAFNDFLKANPMLAGDIPKALQQFLTVRGLFGGQGAVQVTNSPTGPVRQ